MKWISVDAALPIEGDSVLISYKGHVCGTSQGVAIMQRLSRHVGDGAPIDIRWFFSPSFGHEVRPTHWQPLPPSPQSEEP